MATSVTTRAPAWADGVTVSGAEMRAGVHGPLWASAGLVRGLRPTQIPTPGMQIRVPAGLCIVDDGQNGFLPLELAAQTDLDIAASSPTQPRIDSLIAEFVDNGASSLYRLRVLTGTPAASPSAPTVPPADQPTAKTLRVANVAVAANVTSILNANITVPASNAVLASYGRIPTIASDGARPAAPSASESRWRSDKGCFDVYNGAAWAEGYVSTGGPAWTSYTPVLTATTTNPTLGTGSVREGAWYRNGRMVVVRANIKMGTSGVSAGSGTYRVSVPVVAKTLTIGNHQGSCENFDDSANDAHDGVCRITGGTSWNTVELIVNDVVWTSSSPFVLAANDYLGFTITYEAAA
ncbi:hypothetical protein [Actinomadura litoris]|uniref:hypothetical protein n=1 Tax=Actinomadura litoris TaxID=2678616 RepID=UPI001FA7F707|nr:hypothetical protein [Actinomadura litoris]